MSEDALTAGVSGLQPQQAPDAAVSNPVNVGAADKGAFAELLNEIIEKVSAPADGIGNFGTAWVNRNLSQGNIVTTGNPLDMAINGNGYFVLRSNDGNVYTRTGAFAVDGNYKLVDRATGYCVQRFGSVGDIEPAGEGFQTPGNGDISVPFGTPIAAKGTTLLKVSGNLSSNAGQQEVRDFSVPIFDSEGNRHILTGQFIPTSTPDTWQMSLTSITGQVRNIDKQYIDGIEFDAGTGSFKGCADRPEFVITFDFDGSSPQTIAVSMGTAGGLDGLTGFAGSSTAAVAGQDGYAAGELTSVFVDNGTLVGMFSNGQKEELASVQIALFQNPAALENAGDGYYTASTDSGQATPSEALRAGAGEIRSGSLEKSSVDVAADFVNIVQTQNGFQANARTIEIANNILGELARSVR